MPLRKNLYGIYELNHVAVAPMRAFARATQMVANNPFNPFFHMPANRSLSASMELFERLTRKYDKPNWGVTSTEIDGEKVKVRHRTVVNKPFCKLVHFEKEGGNRKFKQEKIMITAPMSGHYATLLRGTVQGLLPYFDVYITEWVNACEVPHEKGDFDLDDYIDYVIEFSEFLKGNCHIMAVCQPVVPVAAAVAIMEAEKNKYHPKSMILVGGPIDGRINPTMVNELADKKPIEWFEQNLITRVPLNYPGHGRKVYPGFLQLAGFLSMKPEDHFEKHKQYFNHLIEGGGDSAEKHEKFYDEYLSVMDITAEFYLQTIKKVFQDFDLPQGNFVSRGRYVNLEAVENTALLALEGEKDDIAGVGQSAAALNLAKNLAKSKKHYHLQKDVGHYGIFNGSRFRKFVVPVIEQFCNKHK